MSPVWIFRFIACEGPGFLAEFLEHREIDYQVIAIDAGDAVPQSIAGASALVLMGGPMSVNDPLPWIGPVEHLVREAQAAGLPVLGHCLGGQLIAKALGGTVGPNPTREVGWWPVTRCAGAGADDWLHGVVDGFAAFHWHGETFSIPSGGQRILESVACPNQAFVMGNTLAMQCHVEVTASMVREWVQLYKDQLEDPAASVQSAAEITAAVDARVAAARAAAEHIYSHWLGRLAPT